MPKSPYFYDIVSARPSIDANQIRQNQMKLAMAVGNNRDSVIKAITMRHFIESAENGGLGRNAAMEVIDDILKSGMAALEHTLNNLPAGFPTAIAEPIADGFLSRLKDRQGGRDALESS